MWLSLPSPPPPLSLSLSVFTEQPFLSFNVPHQFIKCETCMRKSLCRQVCPYDVKSLDDLQARRRNKQHETFMHIVNCYMMQQERNKRLWTALQARPVSVSQMGSLPSPIQPVSRVPSGKFLVTSPNQSPLFPTTRIMSPTFPM